MVLFSALGALLTVALCLILPRLQVLSQPPVLSGRLIALAAAISAVWSATARGLLPDPGNVHLLLGTVLSLACAYDLAARLIPNRLVLIALFLWLSLALAGNETASPERLIEALLMLGFMLLLGALSKGGLGGGDIKLVSFLALCQGFRPALTAAAGGFLLLFLWGLCKPRGNRLTRMLPYAPCLLVSALIMLVTRYV